MEVRFLINMQLISRDAKFDSVDEVKSRGKLPSKKPLNPILRLSKKLSKKVI